MIALCYSIRKFGGIQKIAGAANSECRYLSYSHDCHVNMAVDSQFKKRSAERRIWGLPITSARACYGRLTRRGVYRNFGGCPFVLCAGTYMVYKYAGDRKTEGP